MNGIHKAIAIKQPYAYLIAHGLKPIENRSWSSKYRGSLLIHASAKPDPYLDDICTAIERDLKITLPDEFDTGGIVGHVTMTDCKDSFPMDDDTIRYWYTGEWGHVYADAYPVAFVPFKGKLGIFNAEIDPLSIVTLPRDEHEPQYPKMGCIERIWLKWMYS